MIELNGRVYDVTVLEYKLDIEFLYKYANRTQSGTMESEGLGTYDNQSITIQGKNNPDFRDLITEMRRMENGNWDKDLTIIRPDGNITIKVYPAKLSLSTKRNINDEYWWDKVTLKFIAVNKAG